MISHDNAHCNGTDCPSRECCVRYLLHLDAVKRRLTMVAYIDPVRRGDGCGYYWENKNEEK